MQDFSFTSRPGDLPATELSLEGTLPDKLSGRFLAIGPGRTEIGGQALHLFDGYGRVLSAKLGGATAQLTGKHVQTPVLAEDLQHNAVVKRRAFTNKPSRWSNLFDLDFGNNCVHNVYAFAGQVIAAQDPGHFLLDSDSLEVKRPLDFGGLLKKGISVTPMARVDPNTQRLVVWLQKPGPKDTLSVLELDQDLQVVHEQTCKLPGSGLMHDIGFTEHYYLASRFAELSLPKVLWGAEPLFEALKFNPTSTPVLYLVPRGGGAPRAVQLPGRIHFHFFNTFEQGGELVLDTIGYPGDVSFSSLYPESARDRLGIELTPTPTPVVIRYRIDLETLSLQERIMPGAACEAPAINPSFRGKAYRYGYAASRTEHIPKIDPGAYIWFGAVGKLDFETNSVSNWSAPAGSVCSAPAFVADPDRTEEDAGWVLSWVQNPEAQTTFLAVLDAQHIEAGPVARLNYPDLFGAISHVDFLPN